MSTLAFRPRKARQQLHLSVTPLIDVLFLLIIFFTLTSTFKRVGELELQLPDSSTSTPPAPGDQLHRVELVAKEDGRLLLDGEDLDLPALRGRLLEIREKDAEGRVMIKAEAGLPHGEVVRLLDIVRGAGFAGVGLGTHRTDPAGGSP